MPHQEASITNAVPVGILVYQNRQLSRLVRELRRCSGNARLDMCEANQESTVSHLFEEIASLRNEKLLLYSRLDKLTCSVPLAEGPVLRRPMDLAGGSPEESAHQPSESIASQSVVHALSQEIAELREQLLLGEVRYRDLSQRVDGVHANTSEIVAEGLAWRRKCEEHDRCMFSMRAEWEMEIGKLLETNRLLEKTFLEETERMSEEIAVQTQEIRRLREQLAQLDALAKSGETPNDHHDPGRAQSQPPVRESVGVAPSGIMEATLLKTQNSLRSKEEQLSRILSQHVQLQHTLTAMDQENALLRTRLDDETLRQGHSASAISLTDLTSSYQSRISELESACRGLSDARLHTSADTVVGSNDHTASEMQVAQYRDIVSALQESVRGLSKSLQETRRGLSGQNGTSRDNMGSIVEMELNELRARIKCSLCNQRTKNVTLTTCMHCFCRECVQEKMLNARNRKCPLCNSRFADAEVREIHFMSM
jgi:hypothetical protein